MKKNSNITILVYSTAIATIIASLALTIIIISAEEFAAFKDWLKQNFYHHWLGKSIVTLGLFIAISVLLSIKREVSKLASIILIESMVVIFSVLVIAGFFLLHVLKIV